MNLNCAILHADPVMVEKLQDFVGKVPFLTLCGTYTEPVSALKDYYVTKVEVYIVGLSPVAPGEIGGMDFCRLLSAYTRIIFVADTDRYAAACFRVDALDYLVVKLDGQPDLPPKVIYLRSDSRILRLDLDDICYIESCGDYVKIHCRSESRPLMSLCTMKYMEENLPAGDFVRVHRSYIVRLWALDSIGNSYFDDVYELLPYELEDN